MADLPEYTPEIQTRMLEQALAAVEVAEQALEDANTADGYFVASNGRYVAFTLFNQLQAAQARKQQDAFDTLKAKAELDIKHYEAQLKALEVQAKVQEIQQKSERHQREMEKLAWETSRVHQEVSKLRSEAHAAAENVVV